MNSGPQDAPAQKSALKNPLLYSSLAVLVVALYVGYIMLGRRQSLRESENRAAAAAAQKRRADDREAIEQLGGSELSIRALYLSPDLIRPGQSTELCYDVSNAKTVTLEPPVAEVWPSHNRCIALKPVKTTRYTLTITGATGQTVSQTVELRVK